MGGMEGRTREWLHTPADGCELPGSTWQELDQAGFVVIPGSVPASGLAQLAEAYDAAVSSAAPEDVSAGSSTTRVHDFVNRGCEFDPLYVYPPALIAGRQVIHGPFKLSTMHARTLRPHSHPQKLHVDFARDDHGWPMVGFILMVDEFREDNGATRFVPGSHRWTTSLEGNVVDCCADHPDQVLARGPAGSMILYNGSVWHGHTANRSEQPRRSIQGAYIRREAQSLMEWRARTGTETLARISDLAKYLLELQSP